MKSMLLAFAAIVVIAVGANLILSNMGFSTKDQTTHASVRVD